MTRFYQPDLIENPDSPLVRDGAGKLVRRAYWLDMDDRTLVMVMVNGIGANLTNDEKRAQEPAARSLDRPGLCPGNFTTGEVRGCLSNGDWVISTYG